MLRTVELAHTEEGRRAAVTSAHSQPFLCLSSILEADRLEVLGLTADQGPGVTDPTPN